MTKEINFEIEGFKEPKILMVHGWSGTIQSLKALGNLLSNHASIIRIDLPGRGKSTPPDKNWGVEEYAKHLVDFMKNNQLENCIYFGHSFGGTLGIYIAVNYPEMISKLIVCAPSYNRKPKNINTKQNKKYLIHKLLKKIPGTSRLIKKIYYKIMFPNSELYKVPGLEENFKKVITQDLTPIVKQIKQPTLILWGDKDADVPIKDAYYLKESIKNSVLEVYPNRTHGVPITEPKLLYKNIKDFLKL